MAWETQMAVALTWETYENFQGTKQTDLCRSKPRANCVLLLVHVRMYAYPAHAGSRRVLATGQGIIEVSDRAVYEWPRDGRVLSVFLRPADASAL